MDQPLPSNPTAERKAEYDRFVSQNLRRNYAGNFLHGMLGMTGMRLFGAPTFLPAYLHVISGSDAVVGLGLAMQQLGQMISPIVGAAHIEHRKRMLPAANLLGSLMRVQILLIALSAWLLSGSIRVVAVIGFLLLFGLFTGPQGVAMQVLMAKVIPVELRGRLQAWRNVVGGIIAAGLSFVAGTYFIGQNWLGNGYGATFLLAFLMTTAGLVGLNAIIREPDPLHTRERTPIRERLLEIPALLRSDKPFAYFMLAMSLSGASRVAAPFFILYAAQTIEMTGPAIGLLSVAYMGADTVSNLVWGYWGDKVGFGAVLRASVVLFIAATLIFLNLHSLPWLLVAYCGFGAAQAGLMMGWMTMILEFGRSDDLAMRMAVCTTAQGLVTAVGPIAGGVLAAVAGYPALFCVALAFMGAALTVLIWKVPEPRRRRA